MPRLWWFVCGASVVFVVLPLGFLQWLLSDLSDILPPDEPFSSSYSLPSGEKVTVSGIAYAGFHDNYSSYKIVLRFRNGRQEVVAQRDVNNEVVGPGPFVLMKTSTHFFLDAGDEVYIRPLTKNHWEEWDYRNAPLYFLGRALMPSRYAHRNKFSDNCPTQSNNDCLPEIPYYKFERWNVSSPLVVMRRDAASSAEKKRFLPWPKRLVFRAGKLDVIRTLALERRLKLRPLPIGVHVEFLKMSLPGDFKWLGKVRTSPDSYDLNYRRAQQIIGARILGRESWDLSSHFHVIPLASFLQMRGLCADPDPEILLFSCKIASGEEDWRMAHNGQWIYVSGSRFQNPYIFARFSWPVRQTHSHK